MVHWFWFGVNLEVSEERLAQIGAGNQDIMECIRLVILEWKKKERLKWSKVVQALSEMGYKYKADMLAKKYG